MDSKILEKQFARIGARMKANTDRRRRFVFQGFAVDIGEDNRGPFFDVMLGEDSKREAEVLDIQAADRHLLLLIRGRKLKYKFLCGHDEREWFVAAVPDSTGVGTVRAAMEALKPEEVLVAQARKRLKGRHRNRRHNRAFIRQGEWFFIPQPDMSVAKELVLRNERLSRGRGKPHMAEFAYRTGGETVYVNSDYPQGISERKYKELINREPSARQLRWNVMQRNAIVYARGKVRHPDHKTVRLNGWHQVVPNTESQAASMQHLTFLD
jgi:hypothetical protein